MVVSDVMTRGIVAVKQDATVRSAAELMRLEGVGALPVIAGRRVVGIVTDRDIVTRGVAGGVDTASAPVRSIMTSDVITVGATTPLVEAAELMKAHLVRRLPVVRDEAIVGMLSVDDLASRLGDDRFSGDILRSLSDTYPLSVWEQ